MNWFTAIFSFIIGAAVGMNLILAVCSLMNLEERVRFTETTLHPLFYACLIGLLLLVWREMLALAENLNIEAKGDSRYEAEELPDAEDGED